MLCQSIRSFPLTWGHREQGSSIFNIRLSDEQMPASEDKSGVVWLYLILCSLPMLFCLKEVLAIRHGSALGFITIAALCLLHSNAERLVLPNEDPPIGKRHWDLIKAPLISWVSQLTFFPFTRTEFRYKEPSSKRSHSHLVSVAFITLLDE